ncbi:universal stress protein [Flagellimonas baculiformis]|uniref:universal stress protein n=1 Tax=Flagellimonas baculiformis TaxID=3067310 RepID=UPI00296E27BA|nr:universal stress protein [Muricauda sp. D6]
MKVLLAIDGSEFSKGAIDELAAMSLPKLVKIHVLNVYENPMLTVPGAFPLSGIGHYKEEAMSNAKKSAETIVNNAAKSLKQKNGKLSITTNIVEGFPKNAILEKATDLEVDLIVLGSQGHGAFSRFLLGSVAQSIAMHAHCSVLIVRKKHQK